jgi:hypothetical protein
LLRIEDIAQNVNVVDVHAHRANDGLALGDAPAFLSVVAFGVIVAAASGRDLERGGRRRHRNRPKQPRCNKNNTSNFGPHRSMFLSMGFNR